MLKKFWKKEDYHEFKPLLVEIDERPINPLGRSIFWIVISAILFLIIWSFIGEVDVVISARGQIEPKGRVKSIQPLMTGVIREIHVADGGYVKKGDPLITIDPSTTEPELKSMEETQKKLKLDVLRLESLNSGKPFIVSSLNYQPDSSQTQYKLYSARKKSLIEQITVKELEQESLNEQYSSYASRKKYLRKKYKSAKNRFDRLTLVKGIISRDEYDQAEQSYFDNKQEYDEVTHIMQDLQSKIEGNKNEIMVIKNQESQSILSELSDKQAELTSITAKLEEMQFMNTKQQIISPVDGYVSNLKVFTLGGVVTPAQDLMTIVPDNVPLVAKVQVKNQDIGFIKKNQNSLIKVDTFIFQKYGSLKGNVKIISHDAIIDKKLGPVYDVVIEPQTTTFNVNGKIEPIKSGMTITTEINVGYRKIIEFFIFPLIKHLDEGMSVR